MPLTMIVAPVAQIVKQETLVLHQEVEEILLPKLQQIQSKEDYARILHMFFGYFSPVQQAIKEQLTTKDLDDIHQRRTASLVIEDLQHLDESTECQLCHLLPAVQNTAQAFGALYVLEGSTLGGKMIAKMLLKNEAYKVPSNAVHFFQGYGSQTGPMWTHFLEALNRQTDVDAVVHTANQTFSHLKTWMNVFYDAASE